MKNEKQQGIHLLNKEYIIYEPISSADKEEDSTIEAVSKQFNGQFNGQFNKVFKDLL